MQIVSFNDLSLFAHLGFSRVLSVLGKDARFVWRWAFHGRMVQALSLLGHLRSLA
jgi:hypothetical protein